MIVWIVTTLTHGINFDNIPFIGEDQSEVVGTVLFNYVLAVSIISVVDELVNK